MFMVDGCVQMSAVHDRMPVILRPEQHEQWMQGSPDDAMSLVRTRDDTLVVDRTAELCSKPKKIEAEGRML